MVQAMDKLVDLLLPYGSGRGFVSGDWDIIVRVGLRDISHLRNFINDELVEDSL